MHRPLNFLGGALVLAVLMLPIGVPHAGAQVNRQVLQKLKTSAVALSSLRWRLAETGQGPCKITRADPTSRKICVAKLSCAQPGDSTAGFQLPPLTSTMTLPNAKMTAKVQVTSVSGKAAFNAFANVPGDSGGQQGASAEITLPGVYTVTTGAFDVRANQEYKADVRLTFDQRCPAGCAVEGKILEIRWES